MKQILFTFLLLSVIGLTSCRKSGNDLDIKAYDNLQIQNYITSNGLSGMVKDTTGADSTGIYYQMINPGDPTKPIDYPDLISFVYTIRTFDGKFQALDTALNHYYGYAGHVTPPGLMTAIHAILKYKGAKVRLLIPSHLAYGTNGAGSGSSTLLNGRIPGNQCLDYMVNVIGDQAKYDDIVINSYFKDKNLSGYIKEESSKVPNNFYYYKVSVPGTGTDVITDNSSITTTYAGQLLNGTQFDNTYITNPLQMDMADIAVSGLADALKRHAVVGTEISVIVPSGLAYGTSAVGTNIPANGVLRFDYKITAVTP